MVSVIVLYIEILLDIVGLIAGIVVLARSSDNKLQRAWGLLATSLSALLLGDNLEWIYLFSRGVEGIPRFTDLPMDHLSLWHIFRVIIFFQFYSLFPIASLRPGMLTLSKIINLTIPTILICCIIICYQIFNGHITELDSFDDICKNLGHQDVKLRLFLFIVSVIAPCATFLFPFVKKWVPSRRKKSKAMLFYMISSGMIMVGYIWLMLGTSSLCFNLFGPIVIIPVIYMNVLYLIDENPLTLPPSPDKDLKTEEIEAIREIEVSPIVLELNDKLQLLMNDKTPFTDAKYSLRDMLDELDTNENRLNKALRYNGFSGFRDYINFNRLQYFKEQAMLNKSLTVKELMFKSGFTSRSSFYRYFASVEKMSPSEYMDMLNKEKN